MIFRANHPQLLSGNKMSKIGVLNYGIGNYLSVKNMINHIGHDCSVIENKLDIKKFDKIILPGVGAFDTAMDAINEYKLELDNFVKRGGIILGICLGAQMLGKKSDEGNYKGLGYIDMHSKSFSELGLNANIGWKKVKSFMREDQDLMFYHLHNFYINLNEKVDNYENAHNENFLYINAVKKNNIIGVQYHPEKSNSNGKRFFKWFCEL